MRIYPAALLFGARELCDQPRKMLSKSINPKAKKQIEIKELKAKRNKAGAFTVVAKTWFAMKTKWL